MIDELVEQAKKGNINAFEEVIISYKNVLYKIARTRLSNIDDIEDAFQETIISAYQNIHKLKDITKFKSWIITILINKCNRINRKQNKFYISYEDINAERFISKNDLSSSLGFEDLMIILDEEERTIMTLYYSENYTSKEISKILKIKENTIRKKISNARKKIERNLKEVENYE